MSYWPKAQARYEAANVFRCTLKLNRRTEADLVAALESATNKQALIKTALREYLKKNTRG